MSIYGMDDGEVKKRQQHSKIYIDTHTFSVVVEFPPPAAAEKELIALSDNDFIIIIWANQQ